MWVVRFTPDRQFGWEKAAGALPPQLQVRAQGQEQIKGVWYGAPGSVLPRVIPTPAAQRLSLDSGLQGFPPLRFRPRMFNSSRRRALRYSLPQPLNGSPRLPLEQLGGAGLPQRSDGLVGGRSPQRAEKRFMSVELSWSGLIPAPGTGSALERPWGRGQL